MKKKTREDFLFLVVDLMKVISSQGLSSITMGRQETLGTRFLLFEQVPLLQDCPVYNCWVDAFGEIIIIHCEYSTNCLIFLLTESCEPNIKSLNRKYFSPFATGQHYIHCEKKKFHCCASQHIYIQFTTAVDNNLNPTIHLCGPSRKLFTLYLQHQ